MSDRQIKRSLQLFKALASLLHTIVGNSGRAASLRRNSMNPKMLIIDLNSLLPLTERVEKALAIAQAEQSIIVGIASLDMTFYINQTELRCTLQSIPQMQGIYLCPEPQGKQCLYVTQSSPYPYHLHRQRIARELDLIGKFRKPNPGLLIMASRHLLKDAAARILYVGDRPEDEQTAKAAGIEFEWAENWRGDLADRVLIS